MDILSYEFMIRAFVIGGLSSVLTALLGNFLVAGRQSMVSDMLAHASLAGVGMGIFFHIAPQFMAIGVSVCASSILYFFTRGKKYPPEAVSMMLLTGGVSIAIVFSHFAKNNPVSLETFLFGSLLTTSWNEIYTFAGIFGGGFLFLLLFWNRLLGLFFDPHFMQSRFQRSWIVEWGFFVLLGLVVAFSLKTIGALLIGALLVVPVLTAQLYAQSFLASVFWSMGGNILGVFLGIIVSFYADIPSSSAVVLTLISFFVLGYIFEKIFQKAKNMYRKRKASLPNGRVKKEDN